MLSNRSIPRAIVIPELAYPDVAAAAHWLCEVFGFRQRLVIGSHRIQICIGDDGAMVVVEGTAHAPVAGHVVLVRIADVDAHHAASRRHGARILRAPADYPYGERQYTAQDFAGHQWTFSQTIADVDPAQWGGQLVGPGDGAC
jgi:uncharacterized glyoxalase superfamily protein PhnB